MHLSSTPLQHSPPTYMPCPRKREQGRPSLFKRIASRCYGLLSLFAVSRPRTNSDQEPSEANSNSGPITGSDEPAPHPSPSMPAFDIVVVGAGGGPDETNLSAYLVKPHPARWEDGVLALEAGSGQGALRGILDRKPDLFASPDGVSRALTATEVYNAIRCFLITHAHLDHINGLVVSAGSLTGPRKRIYAVEQTLKDIASVFNDRIWPNLASWDENDQDYKLLYAVLKLDSDYTSILPNVSVKTFPLNHGANEHGPYESSAYFVRYDPTGTEFLFFGDVEPDSLTSRPQTINVWNAAASKIPDTLRAIFIECSWPSGRPDSQLFGHLTPEHLVKELVALATEVQKIRQSTHASEAHSRHTRKRQRRLPSAAPDIRGALAGLTIYVTHCKDGPCNPDNATPMREVILEQVQSLVRAKDLGCNVLAVKQGMYIHI